MVYYDRNCERLSRFNNEKIKNIVGIIIIMTGLDIRIHKTEYDKQL